MRGSIALSESLDEESGSEALPVHTAIVAIVMVGFTPRAILESCAMGREQGQTIGNPGWQPVARVRNRHVGWKVSLAPLPGPA